MTLNTSPEWNLKDLYLSPTDPQIRTDLAECKTLSEAFYKKYKGQIKGLSAEELKVAIGAYEKIKEKFSKLGSYAFLNYSTAMNVPENGSLYQLIKEEGSPIYKKLIFFTLELNQLEEGVFLSLLTAPSLLHYKPWLEDVRSYKDHQLKEDIEQVFLDKSITSGSAWVRLYDETLASLEVHHGEKTISLSEALHLFSSKEPKVRAEVAQSLSKALKEKAGLITLTMNTLLKDKAIDDEWRHFDSPQSERHLANQVDKEAVESLVTAVKRNYGKLSHRYYTLKAKWLGLEKLPYWDRMAPLFEVEETKVPWEKAKEIVLKAYRDFSPEMAEIAEEFFAKNWIDARPKKGKESGAYSHPAVPSAHPYILMNYQEQLRDVMTLAHELGHGIHQVLSAKQGYLLSDTPLTLAETASVFGEMLTFKSLLKETKDLSQKKYLLSRKIEDMLNTVVRQIAFHEFEVAIHNERAQGEISQEKFGELWAKTQSESLGEACFYDESYHVYWTYISHFFHVPFYVYAYAFGDCLVNALYTLYEENRDGFTDKYLTFLKAGGTLRYEDLFKAFGFEAKDPAFWEKGLKVIENLIDELESL